MTLSPYPARRAGRVLTLLSLTGLCAATITPAQAGLSITDLASFTATGAGTNGADPQAGVTFDSSGNLFGTTTYGGASGAGTVYEIAKGTSTITDLASFTGAGPGTNGGNPAAGVTFDSSGNLFGTTYQGGAYGYGTVYEIAHGTNTITDLASFTGAGTNGADPVAGVTFDSSGNLFGTTAYGGASGAGTVYEIAKGTSTITDLASFTGAGTNGAYPYAGVTFDSSGNLFGTTTYGGASGLGTVYEIAHGTNTFTDLASFTGNGTNGARPYAGVTFDSSGNLFGTTASGGASGVGTVYEIAQGTSTITTLAFFTGNGAGTNGGEPLAGVTFDSSGNLFGTTYGGGASGYGTVYEIAQGTSTITDLASFTGAGTNGAYPYAGVTFDSSGNLFGTTYGGGASGAGTVYEIAGAGSPVPESSTVISFATLLGLGGLLLRARKRGQNATPGA